MDSGRDLTARRLVSLSPTLGSVLIARSLEPASDSVSPFLSLHPLPPTHTHSLPFSLSEINKHYKKNFFNSNLKSRHCFTDISWYCITFYIILIPLLSSKLEKEHDGYVGITYRQVFMFREPTLGMTTKILSTDTFKSGK